MTNASDMEIFLVVAPGLENTLCEEARAKGFSAAKPEPGGVSFRGNWQDVWRANLELRGPTRVLARLGEFRVGHLAQLDKLARKFAWNEILRSDVPVRVDVTCKKSRIYHSKAAAQRIETAIAEELGAEISKEASIRVLARIENNLCTLSIDTSGEMLHRRGFKEAVNKAPMRETLAALFLKECGFDGTEPVVDPMCGSGTFVLEAAEIALGLWPGRAREFAFEQLVNFDQAVWDNLKSAQSPKPCDLKFYGSDRDAGAIRMCEANAERAGVDHLTDFQEKLISEITPPEGPPGLVMVNPPYGTRIGNQDGLSGLYKSLGKSLLSKFSGWRVGLVTSDAALARATGLAFGQPGPFVDHGGLKIRLYTTGALR